MTIWNQIKNLFSRSNPDINEPNHFASGETAVPAMNQQNMVDLMHRLEKTLEGTYSCDEAYALLDEYVELVADNEEARQLMPLVETHLDMCPDCRDEFELLLQILKTADTEE
ncbi:anti-sigma factor family protein [Candidatus Leptofilum sp.]|uniref:anti-sigma factor family protein n=1 Tax=Candidatus Leptofilum sp. TaxID=3241576 RepID=UPI003B5BAD20